MATSSFFYQGSNAPDQTQTQTTPTVAESTEDTVKTSFYYGSTPGPDQNTFNELVKELNDKIDEVSAEKLAAKGYANASNQSAQDSYSYAQNALSYSQTAAASAASAQVAKADAESASSTAVLQVAEAEDLLDQANAIISSFTISTASPSGGEEGDVWFKVSF